MLARSSIGRSVQRAARQPCIQRRGLAAPASGSLQYQTGDADGVKFASRDLGGSTTALAVVARAGPRYQLLPCLAEALEKYAFRHTTKRTSLRIVRESELFGAQLLSYHSRENIVLLTKFFRDDLPYFAELLAEVITSTRYIPYVMDEEVLPLLGFANSRLASSPVQLALNSAHGLAFHRGLGTPLNAAYNALPSKYLNAESVEHYAQAAYAKPNIAVVANGAEHSNLSKWVHEFFQDVRPSAVEELRPKPTEYYGGEERLQHSGGNAMVLGFPGSTSFTGPNYRPEIAVLAALLGGKSNIKWSPGSSLLGKVVTLPATHITTKSAIYSDAGLLYVEITGPAQHVGQAATEVVKALRKVAENGVGKEDAQKARAAAKFKELEYGEEVKAGLELTGSGLVQGSKPYSMDEVAKKIDGVTAAQVQSAAKALLEGKASVATVGDLHALPFASEISLKV